MIQSLDEENNPYIQRFDTPIIRDLDFPKESGDQPMPLQQNEPLIAQEVESTPETPAQAAEQEVPAAEPLTATAPILPQEHEEHPDEQMTQAQQPVLKLDPHVIPKFINQLFKPPVYFPASSNKEDDSRSYIVDISEFQQQILPPGYPQTTVWGYGGTVMDAQSSQLRYFRNAPGATLEAVKNMPFQVKWINRLSGPVLFETDPMLYCANPNVQPTDPPTPALSSPPSDPATQSGASIETNPPSDDTPAIFAGNADALYTYDNKIGGSYDTALYKYSNKQEPITQWYHDYAQGIAPHNVYAGLAGFYLLRGGYELSYHQDYNLPKGRYEIPIILQDLSFNTDGSIAYTNPESFGDSIMANGTVWPNLDVERRQYRFRLLNGSSARYYNLKMSNGMPFVQIGSSDGFLPAPVELDTLLLAPAERADILIDFSSLTPGTKIILTNDASAPFPNGDKPDPITTGQIMQFTVPANAPQPVTPQKLPKKLTAAPRSYLGFID